MTDGMNRPTKHGLGSPPNDGAPRPNPPRGYDQTPEMLAVEDAAAEQTIRRQGFLAGLRRAANLICYECGHPSQDGAEMEAAVRQGGRWVHRFAGTDNARYCRAGHIHDEIIDMERAKP